MDLDRMITFNDAVIALAEGGDEQAQILRLALENHEALKNNDENAKPDYWDWRGEQL